MNRRPMMSTAGPTASLDAIKAQVKRLINAQLKQVCKNAGLPVSGAKAALQGRIINREPPSHYSDSPMYLLTVLL